MYIWLNEIDRHNLLKVWISVKIKGCRYIGELFSIGPIKLGGGGGNKKHVLDYSYNFVIFTNCMDFVFRSQQKDPRSLCLHWITDNAGVLHHLCSEPAEDYQSLSSRNRLLSCKICVLELYLVICDHSYY